MGETRSANPPLPAQADPSVAGAPGRPIRRAPLVPVAAAMAAGIVLGRWAPLPVGLWAAVGLACLIAAAVTLRREHLRGLTAGGIAAAIFFGAATAAALAWWRIPDDHIAAFSGQGSVPATIRGRVSSVPRIRPASAAYWRPPKTTFLLKAGGIRRADGQWLPVRGLVRVTVGEPADELAPGQQVELVGLLRRFRPPANPGQHDWAAANRIKRILVGFHVPGRDGAKVLTSAPAGAIRGLWRRLRALARRHLEACGDRDEAILLEALVLGERDPALRELNQAMVEAGVAHFLSISGLHLGIFLGFVYWLGRVLMFSPRRSAGAVLAVLAVYLLLAEPRPPLLRGAVMAAAVCVATISGRRVATANALAAAAVVLLAIDPLQLFTPGFQLSFGIVCGIVILHKPLQRLLFGRWLSRRGLMVFRDQHRLRRWLYYRAADWAIGLACLSLSAYVSAVPLVAYHFGLFTPYAPLLSIILLPVMIAVLIPAYVSMALALPMPNLAAHVGDLAAAAAGALTQLVGLLGHLPGLSVDLFAVPVWLVVLCYVTTCLWALARRWRPAFSAAAAATLALAAATALTQRPAPAPADGELHVLSVGHGAMTLLHAPDGKTYLFDAGSLGSTNAYQQVLRPFLRAKRLPPPQRVFVSHANIDHYNALPGLLRRTPPRLAYLNESFGRRADNPPGVRRLMEAFAGRGVEIVRLGAGKRVRLGPKTSVEVLWPPGDRQAALDVNDSSLVLRLVCGARSVLIPADVRPAVQTELAARQAGSIAADVLMLPHHGSASPALKQFIEAVGASVLIQSSHFRPDSPELLESIAGRRRYATWRDGWIHVGLAEADIHVETMRDTQGSR